MARIQCTNPECRHEIFRPFSCKRFYLCPACDAHGCASGSRFSPSWLGCRRTSMFAPGEVMDGHEPASQKKTILVGELI